LQLSAVLTSVSNIVTPYMADVGMYYYTYAVMVDFASGRGWFSSQPVVTPVIVISTALIMLTTQVYFLSFLA